MAYDASTDYKAIQNALKKQMEETTDEQEQAQLRKVIVWQETLVKSFITVSNGRSVENHINNLSLVYAKDVDKRAKKCYNYIKR